MAAPSLCRGRSRPHPGPRHPAVSRRYPRLLCADSGSSWGHYRTAEVDAKWTTTLGSYFARRKTTNALNRFAVGECRRLFRFDYSCVLRRREQRWVKLHADFILIETNDMVATR